jgi:hypothetical protein
VITVGLAGALSDRTGQRADATALCSIVVASQSKTKLYGYINEGTLKACYVGAHMRVHKDDIRAVLAALRKVGGNGAHREKPVAHDTRSVYCVLGRQKQRVHLSAVRYLGGRFAGLKGWL